MRNRIYELGSVDSAGKFEAKSEEQLLTDATARNLDIRCDTVQGCAGLAFIEGAMKEATGEHFDANLPKTGESVFERALQAPLGLRVVPEDRDRLDRYAANGMLQAACCRLFDSDSRIKNHADTERVRKPGTAR